MIIGLDELNRHFTEENINATAITIIQQMIRKVIQILEDKIPNNSGKKYRDWESEYALLKSTEQGFFELYDLLVQRIPIYEEKCQLLYKDKTKWHKGKNDVVERHIEREWIVIKRQEFQKKIEVLKFENPNLTANKSKTEEDEYQNTVRFLENMEVDLKNFINFIDSDLKGKMSDCFKKVTKSKCLRDLTIELEPEMLLNHLRSGIVDQIAREVNCNNSKNGKETFYIFYGKDTCLSKGHKIENVKAVINNLKNGLNDVMNIMYCQHCKTYRISFLSYQNYTKNNIIPAVIIKTIKSAEANGLNDHSVLSLYGYSVGLKGLSKNVRQRILVYLLDAQIATKAQILDLLRFDITYMGKRKGMEESVKNWNTDIRFVNDYKISKQRVVRGGKFANGR